MTRQRMNACYYFCMPYLKHIVEPLLRKNLDSLRADLPPPSAPPLPSEAPARAIHPVFGDIAAANEYRIKVDEAERNGRGSFMRSLEEGSAVYAPNDPKLRAIGKDAGPETYGEAESAPAKPASYTQIGSRPAPAPQIESYDPRAQTPQASYAAAVGTLPNTAGWIEFKKSALGFTPQVQAMTPVPTPVAPDGPTPMVNKRGQAVMDLGKAGDPIGVAEDGQAVDRYGKKLGYLNQPDPGFRSADRNAGDFTLEDRDPVAIERLQGVYGQHLKAVEDNEGKFPAGYFKKMSADEKKNIIKGVHVLQQLARGTRT